MASQVPIPPPKPKQLPLGYETFSDKAIRKTKEQPLVPIGIGATIAALTKAAIEIRRGNSRAANKFFRYRVYAQGATVITAVGSMWYYGNAQEQKGARIEADRQNEKLKFEQRLNEVKEDVEKQSDRKFKSLDDEPVKKSIGIADLDLRGTTWEKLPSASTSTSPSSEQQTSTENNIRAPLPTSGRFSTKDPLTPNRKPNSE